MQDQITQPNSKCETANDRTNCEQILQLYTSKILHLIFKALNAFTVAVSRAYIICSGDVAVAATIKPRYLNCLTYLNSLPSSEIVPEQCTNKTSVL